MPHRPMIHRPMTDRRTLLGLAGASVAACWAGGARAQGRPPEIMRDAYARYVAAIETARAEIRNSVGVRSEADFPEGESFLHGIVNASVSMAMINTPDAPLGALIPHPDARLGFNNPDNNYYAARISDAHSYVLSGRRGSSRTLLFQAIRGLPGAAENSGETLSFLSGEDLALNQDGSYTITLSAERPASGNWLPLRPGADNLLIRFSFLDWAHEQPGSFVIARNGAAPYQHVEITPARAAAMLQDAAALIIGQAHLYCHESAAFARMGANHIVGPVAATASQASHSRQWRLFGTFDLAEDEAMIVTVKDAPGAEYNNFMAANAWFDTFEFVRHQPSLNRSQVRVDEDGYIRYVISAADPGAPNWIDTTGRLHGLIFSRWQEAPGGLDQSYAADVRVAKRDEVMALLPPGTPRVTPQQRSASLAERTRLLRNRFEGADPALPEIVRRLRAVEALAGARLPVQTINLSVLD